MLERARGPLGTLIAHVARANPIWRRFAPGREVLVVFQGPHAYVSPDWYAASGLVPTWNYVAVHGYGVPRLLEGEAAATAALAALSDAMEAGLAPKPPWRLERLSESARRGLVRGIVAFEIELLRLEGKQKLNQNRSAADRAGVIAALEAQGDAESLAMARAMSEREDAPRRPDSGAGRLATADIFRQRSAPAGGVAFQPPPVVGAQVGSGAQTYFGLGCSLHRVPWIRGLPWPRTTISTCVRSTTTSSSSRCRTISMTASSEEVDEGVNILLERGWQPYDVLTEALVGGMTIVGIDFRDGILFVPEVLLAANAMKGGMAILRPLLAETGAPTVGKMVIGTVKGDIHDIGKNLVSMMMEGAGFEVIDLGINCAVEKYLDALEEHKPDILGMSALLTTTMPYMKVVIDTLKDKGIRDDYIVLVGGAPLERGVRRGGRRRRLLPRRRGRGRDRESLRRAPAQPPAGRRRSPELLPRRARSPPTARRPALRTLLIACGALAREVLRADRAERLAAHAPDVPAGQAAQPPASDPGGGARQDPRRPAALRADPGASTATAARAASSTACSPTKASSAFPGPHCYAFYAGLETFLEQADADPDLLLPHRLPGRAISSA